MLDYLISFLILTGAIFTFIGSLGLARLQDFYTRLHGPTKATTLGVGCLLIASSVYFSAYAAGLSLHEILITIFLFITAPVSAHMLAKAALHVELRSLVEIPDEKVIIRPQGLYKKNAYRKDNRRARSRLRAELGLDKDARVVLGVGYLDHRKGVDLFVDAALQIIDSIPDAHFVWVGYWESNMKTLIEEKIAAATSPEKIHFVGRKDDTDIYYAGADVFVLSSREDPFPSTVMESLEVGIPVVAFKDAGGFETLLERGCGIMVPFEDSLRLAEAIMELLNNPALARKLGNTGASIIDWEFSFRHYVYDLLDLAGQARRRISVIVPNYNYARYLEQRLNSIFLQTYPVFELIVLDDASSDKSLEVINNCLAKTDIDHQLIINSKNSGSVFGQWRKAIKLARGDFIWICEADDFAKPDFLEKCINKFSDPEVVLSYTQSMQVDENGKVINDDYLDYTNEISKNKWQQDYVCDGFEELSKALAVKNTIPNVSAVVFRKTSLQESLDHCERQIKKLKIAGDWLIYSDLLQKGRIAFTSESLNAHRRHHKSITIDPNNNNRHMAEIIYMQIRISRLVKLDQETIAKAKGFEQHAYHHLGLANSSENSADPVKLPEVQKWFNRISSPS
jgi:monovalent cation/proton antiporter MnhG/PhaG subunit